MLCLLLFTAVVDSQHVWNLIQTNEESYCQLSKVFEDDFYFINDSMHEIDNFTTTNDTFEFGLVLGSNATFSMIYSISCKQVECNQTKVPCPRIVFLVSADGPGIPVVFINGYKGALGRWWIVQSDLQFQIQFV